MTRLYGGVEAGGTKFVCAIGTDPGNFEEIRFPTSDPASTLAQVVAFFEPYQKKLQAIGVGSFGPVDLHSNSSRFGYITSTPKPGWQNTDVVGPLKEALEVPVAFDTDVNAAAAGEGLWGAAKGLSDYLYVTIGTGIGGGAVSGGRLVHGLVHPEMGHCLIEQRSDDSYAGGCPFHGNRCLEGLASGPAIAERWGKDASTLPLNHPAWDMETDYIAQALVNYLCILSPQRIILGGGVMDQKHLLARIHNRVIELLNGYIQTDQVLKQIDTLIVAPQLGSKAGVLGAIALAKGLISKGC